MISPESEERKEASAINLSEYSKQREGSQKIEMHNWMKHVPEITKIKDMTLPGSHNAGSYMTKNFIVVVKDFVVC
jgi:hypothetical protein